MRAPHSRWSVANGVILLGSFLISEGCSERTPIILGQSPAEVPVALADSRGFPAQTSVTISGVMVEKCPEAGCWFVLKAQGGTVKVDTKTAGFVVVDVPLNRPVTVVGHWLDQGRERIFAAQGLRY